MSDDLGGPMLEDFLRLSLDMKRAELTSTVHHVADLAARAKHEVERGKFPGELHTLAMYTMLAAEAAGYLKATEEARAAAKHVRREG